MTWATKDQARAHWADAVSLTDGVLDALLNAAYEGCVAYAPKVVDRTVADGVTVTGSPIITSATAAFKESEVGRLVSGTGIVPLTRIDAVLSATSVILAANATGTSTEASLTITGVPTSYMLANIYQAREVYAASQRGESDVIGVGDYAIRARPLTAAVKQLLRPTKGLKVVG